MSGPVVVDAKNATEKAREVKNGEHIQPAKTLAEALARIYADGGRYVQKTGQMTGGPARYSYAKEGDFIAAVRPLMELHGVTIRPVKYDVLTNEEFTRKSGGSAYRAVVLATFEFMHTSGDKATAQAIGEGQDSGDKAFNKAMTAAMKYVLRQSFCTETGDDPDDVPSHTQERAAAPARDNMQARAQFAQRYAQAKSRDDVVTIGNEVAQAAKGGRLSEDDCGLLRAVANEALERFPRPAKV